MATYLNRKIGEMDYDNLVIGLNPKTDVRAATIRKLAEEATIKRGTILAKSNVDGKCVVLGTSAADATATEKKFSGDATETVFTVTEKPERVSVKVGGVASTDFTYDNSTGKITFGTAPALGTDNIIVSYSNEDAEVLTPFGIVTDDVDVGTEADVVTTIYTAGCFNAEKCITADGYTITAADYDELRRFNIVFQAAQS